MTRACSGSGAVAVISRITVSGTTLAVTLPPGSTPLLSSDSDDPLPELGRLDQVGVRRRPHGGEQLAGVGGAAARRARRDEETSGRGVQRGRGPGERRGDGHHDGDARHDDAPSSPQDDPVILELHPTPDSRDPSERRNPNRRLLVDRIADTFPRVKRIRVARRRVSARRGGHPRARAERRSWGSRTWQRGSPRCGDAARASSSRSTCWCGWSAGVLARAAPLPERGQPSRGARCCVMAACDGRALRRPRHADPAARGAGAHRQLRRDAAARVGRGAQRCGGLRRPTSSARRWPAACPRSRPCASSCSRCGAGPCGGGWWSAGRVAATPSDASDVLLVGRRRGGPRADQLHAEGPRTTRGDPSACWTTTRASSTSGCAACRCSARRGPRGRGPADRGSTRSSSPSRAPATTGPRGHAHGRPPAKVDLKVLPAVDRAAHRSRGHPRHPRPQPHRPARPQPARHRHRRPSPAT